MQDSLAGSTTRTDDKATVCPNSQVNLNKQTAPFSLMTSVEGNLHFISLILHLHSRDNGIRRS